MRIVFALLALGAWPPQETPESYFNRWASAFDKKDGGAYLDLYSTPSRAKLIEIVESLKSKMPDPASEEFKDLQDWLGIKADLRALAPQTLTLAFLRAETLETTRLSLVKSERHGDRGRVIAQIQRKDGSSDSVYVWLVMEGGKWTADHLTQQKEREQHQECVEMIGSLSSSLSLVWLDSKAYPKSGNASMVKTLLKQPGVQFEKEQLNAAGELLDPWGRPMVYVNPLDGKDAKPRDLNPFILYSVGPDGRDDKGAGDDIANTDPESGLLKPHLPGPKIPPPRELRRSNERQAIASIKTLASAETDFRSNDRDGNLVQDYWVGDVSGLYRGTAPADRSLPIKLIERVVAEADASPLTLPELVPHTVEKPRPFRGYAYVAARAVVVNGKTQKYHEGSHRNPTRFGFVAYPTDYPASGMRTFFVDEGWILYSKDTGGKVPDVLPEEPHKAGWKQER